MSDICAASLLPVVVGGAIGIIAGLVGPYFIQRQKDAADKKRTRAENFKELVGAVAEHFHWIYAMQYFAISGQGNWLTLSPITKIQAIASTYFPEFDFLVRQFESASFSYERWILGIAQKRVKGEPGYEELPGHDEVTTKYMEKRAEFLAELQRFARREFQ